MHLESLEGLDMHKQGKQITKHFNLLLNTSKNSLNNSKQKIIHKSNKFHKIEFNKLYNIIATK